MKAFELEEKEMVLVRYSGSLVRILMVYIVSTVCVAGWSTFGKFTHEYWDCFMCIDECRGRGFSVDTGARSSNSVYSV